MAAPAPARVLVVGAVNGRLDLLAPRVATVNAAHGPFDVVLCTGGLYSQNPAENLSIDAFLVGDSKFPVDMLFINGPTPIPRHVMEVAERNGGQLCENITFLGQRGVLTTTSGLKIAYLSGTFDPTLTDPVDTTENPSATRYARADVDALLRTAKGRSGFGGVDILLTMDWPRGVTRLAPLPEGTNVARSGSDSIAELARELRPRYHFAAQEPDVFFERPPYRNLPLMPGRPIHVTRFFGMAAVGNERKAKWLYAMNLIPMAHAEPMDALNAPPTTTPNPFEASGATAALAAKRDAAEMNNGTFFFGEAAYGRGRGDGRRGGEKRSRMPEGYICHKCGQPGHMVRECPQLAEERAARAQGGPGAMGPPGAMGAPAGGDGGGDPTSAQAAAARALERNGAGLFGAAGRSAYKHPNEGCWFCLANPQVEKHLVVSVGAECYLALAKGGLTPDHVLIVPLGHFASTGALPAEAKAELARYKEALRKAFAAAGKAPLFFEVNTRSPHTHVQVIPVPADKAAAVGQALETQAGKLGFQFQGQEPAADGPQGSFFRAELPADGRVLYHPIGQNDRFPIQMGRHTMAHLLEMPQRADWKACVKSADDEKADAAAFRAFFGPHDFSLADDE